MTVFDKPPCLSVRVWVCLDLAVWCYSNQKRVCCQLCAIGRKRITIMRFKSPSCRQPLSWGEEEGSQGRKGSRCPTPSSAPGRWGSPRTFSRTSHSPPSSSSLSQPGSPLKFSQAPHLPLHHHLQLTLEASAFARRPPLAKIVHHCTQPDSHSRPCYRPQIEFRLLPLGLPPPDPSPSRPHPASRIFKRDDRATGHVHCTVEPVLPVLALRPHLPQAPPLHSVSWSPAAADTAAASKSIFRKNAAVSKKILYH